MSVSLYNLAIYVYTALIHLASPFNTKARQWVEGRRQKDLDRIDEISVKKKGRIWFHCASLGEYEMALPLIRRFRKNYPEALLLISFFSPSGYLNTKKNLPADLAFYLPADTAKNAHELVNTCRPDLFILVKYEYWYHLINKLHESSVPVWLIGAAFRPSQAFFKPYGAFFRKILTLVDYIFVRDQDSANLLTSIGLSNFTITGDTRFDRVIENTAEIPDFPLIDAFCENSKVIVCGSTWPEDEKLLTDCINKGGRLRNVKWIIAPHEVDRARVTDLKAKLKGKVTLYSKATEAQIQEQSVLIIDSIGMLSRLYRYADIAYVGGAFRTGLHNILEPAVFEKPVLFGPKYHKYPEAVELIKSKAAYPVKDTASLHKTIDLLIRDNELRTQAGLNGGKYILQHKGSVDKIWNHFLSDPDLPHKFN